MSAALPRRIAGALLGGAALLMAEVRFEHREVLGETWRAWIPIAFLGMLLAAGAVAWVRWQRGGRKVLIALFGLSIAVGLLGAWFHSDGKLLRSMARVGAAWALKPGENGGEKPGAAPPVLAPLALCGLGLLGVIACGAGSAEGRTPAPLGRE